MSEAKSVSVPADVHSCLRPVEEVDEHFVVPYREAVGSHVSGGNDTSRPGLRC
ncbi:hypothetical protein X777_05495 [Ooceraea biroi]|uniref:Uncharacterized protein n=1 Tax=Ooceraea biroi TaxID=2015173 RepID=A0A026WFZ7_OOCBI|nr:hypothetical protein X777_05495 [Ooceraea biroi]